MKRKNKNETFFYLFAVFTIQFNIILYSNEKNIITKEYDIIGEKQVQKTFSYYLCTFKQFAIFKHDLISYSRKKMLVKGSIKVYTEQTNNRNYYNEIKSIL